MICSLRPLTLLATLALACGNNGTTKMDMAAHDMATSASDMSSNADMTCVPQTLNGVNCAAAMVNANTVYSQVAMPNCSGTSCHINGPQTPQMGASGATLITALVNKQSTAGMNYVTANNVDKSYVLFKIFGQQLRACGNGSPMPLVGMLTMAQQCLLVNWVKSGAM